MRAMKIFLRIVTTVWLTIAGVFLLLNVYCIATEGLKPWNVTMAAAVIGMTAVAGGAGKCDAVTDLLD